MSFLEGQPELGIGALKLGRPGWGEVKTRLISESEALTYLDVAYELAIRHYDTARAYGLSEERLGKWLDHLTEKERASVTVATKCGQFFNLDTEQGSTNHKRDILIQSIDTSVQLLGIVPDILYVHGADTNVLETDSVYEALEYAKNQVGIPRFGASVRDPQAGFKALENPLFSVIQLPYYISRPGFGDVIEAARQQDRNITIVVNRPLGEGKLVYQGSGDQRRQIGMDGIVDAYQFITDKLETHGIVLTGTSSVEHLRENKAAFDQAIGRK